MNFCSNCGYEKLAFRIPPLDSLPRYICDRCGTIHYQNPKLVVGCIPELEEKVLLCRRAIEPRYGYWTLPAGFMENGESTEEGAIRETYEEANAEIKGTLKLFSIYSIPSINQVHLFFKASLKDHGYKSGSESLEVKLFDYDNIPWDKLAFATVKKTLIHYLEDLTSAEEKVHVGTIEKSPQIKREDKT